MDIPKKVAINTFASYAGRVAGSAFALISVGFITRALGREGFGEYSTIVAYLATAQILADLGLYSLLTREISQKPEQERELLSYFFTLRLTAAVIFLAAAVVFVWALPYSGAVRAGIAMSAVAFLFLSLAQILASVFQKYVQVYKAAIAEFAGRAIQLGVVVFFFVAHPSLLGFLIALVAGSLVIFLVNVFFAYRLVPFYLAVSLSKWRNIIKTAWPIAASIVFTLLYFRADTIMLSLMRGQEDVGVYNIAYKVLESLIFFPAVFVGLMLPIMSRYVQESRAQTSKLLGRLTDIITVFTLPMAVGGILLSSSIVNAIGGSEFLISTATLQVLFIAIAVISYGTLFGNATIALNLQKKALWIYACGFFINFISNLFVIPRYTYLGAAWTTVGTEIFVTFFLTALVWRSAPFNVSFIIIAKAALATVLMGVAVWSAARTLDAPLHILELIAVVFLSAGLYFFILRFLHVPIRSLIGRFEFPR